MFLAIYIFLLLKPSLQVNPPLQRPPLVETHLTGCGPSLPQPVPLLQPNLWLQARPPPKRTSSS